MAKIVIVGRKSHHPMDPQWGKQSDARMVTHKRVSFLCTISPAHKIFLLKFNRGLCMTIKLSIRVEIRPTPTNPVDEDVTSKPSVILNWSYERIIYNRPITSEPPIASKNTEGSISISTNGSYKRKIPRISLVCHINTTSVFFFFSRPSMYIQTITGSALAIILKTFLPQGRVTVWRWVQITNIVVWKHLITFKSGRLYSFEPKTEY